MSNFETLAEKYASVEIKFAYVKSHGNQNPWATSSTEVELVEFFVDEILEGEEFLNELCLTSIEAPISKTHETIDCKDDDMGGLLVTAEITTTVYFN